MRYAVTLTRTDTILIDEVETPEEAVELAREVWRMTDEQPEVLDVTATNHLTIVPHDATH